MFFASVVITACDFSKPAIDATVQEALKKQEAELAQQSMNPAAHFKLAQTYEKAGLTMKAADAYLQVLELDPIHADGMAALGRIYEKLGYYTASFRRLHQCLKTESDHPECLYQIGALLRKDGSKTGLTQSLSYWRRFLRSSTTHPKLDEVRRAVGEVEAQLDTTGRPAQSEHTITEAAPDPDQASDVISSHEGASGSEDVGQLNPFGAAIGRAIAAIRKKDSSTAEAAFRVALTIRPKDAGALAGLAETLFHQGKNEAAQKAVTKAYDSDPKNTQAQWVYGLIMIKSGKNMARALEAWNALQRDSPEFAAQVGVTKTLEAVQKMPTSKKVH
jgi:cytochrome c-type biogenesis protein CcmH/NrfG